MKFIIWFAKNVIRVAEIITGTEITVRRKHRVKIKTHPMAVNNGDSMFLYVGLVEKFCTFKPVNIFEIGANYAQDAEFLRKSFGLNESDVFVFEPHPQIIKSVRTLYKFNSYEMAVSNTAGRAVLNAIDIDNNEYKNSGISSLKEGLTTDKRNFVNVDVEVVRMDEFTRENQIENIDFLKLDVEGVNYEVLEGFGDKLSMVKSIQIEGEYHQYWEGQKLFWDIAELLRKNEFDLVHFILSDDGIQSDSFWIQKQYIKRI